MMAIATTWRSAVDRLRGAKILRLPAVRNLAQRMTVWLASADQRPLCSAMRYGRCWPTAEVGFPTVIDRSRGIADARELSVKVR